MAAPPAKSKPYDLLLIFFFFFLRKRICFRSGLPLAAPLAHNAARPICDPFWARLVSL
jgi:hypothetical protein